MSYELVKRENCLKELITRYKTLGSSIIYHVAEQENFDVRKANMVLMELTGSITIRRQYTRTPRIENPDQYISVAQIEECIDSVLTGARVLIILRGLPGSGKSYLAKSILTACYSNPNHKDHIHSADNFFMQNGRYMFEARQLGDAHQWNQKNVDYRMQEGYSPLIVDNTNCQMWEMRNYIPMAVNNGYKIHILEINTRWAFNLNELTKRNRHNVPKQSIKAMLERYEMGITAESLLKSFPLTLVYQEDPAPRRCPPFIAVNRTIGDSQSRDALNQDLSLPKCKKKDQADNRRSNSAYSSSDQDEEFLRGTTASRNFPRPVQQYQVSSPGEKASNWSPFKFSWDTDIGEAIKNWNLLDSQKYDDPTVHTSEKKHTCEIGVNTSMMDFYQDVENSKVVYGKSREISDIRKKLTGNKPGMLDKSCSTHDDVSSDRNEDLKKLIDIFQNIPPSYIRDMYDDCKGDFDMTFEIFLEDSKDYSHLLYNVDTVICNTNEVQEQKQEHELSRNVSLELLDEASALPQENLELLDTSVFKYSESGPCASTGAIKKYPKLPKIECKTPDIFSDEDNTIQTPTISDIDSDIDDQSTSSEFDTVELNFGEFLVKQLEQQFGDPSNNFPAGFQPVVQVPKALARQLYAFYVESAYQQMEAQQSILDQLVKEDEAFAKKLYEEEIGMVHSPPPEGLQEIMNEQAAMNIHKKQLPELKTPNDLATQMTKKKLFECFPSVDQGVILEVYHANGLDYQQTVGDLINSVGPLGYRPNTNITEPPISPSTIQELERAQKESKPAQDNKNEEKTPKQYREEAEYYLSKRNELYQKAQEHHNKGQREVAQFYSQLAQQQTQYYDIANNKAASVFLDENSRQLQNMNTLDLHYLFVKEAISALDVFIDTNIDRLNTRAGKVSQDLLIITGRGKRSLNGVSKIRPAVIRRLEARNIKYHKMNPGLLKIKIKGNTPVTNDL